MSRPGPPPHIRALGKVITTVSARAPFAWPLLRGPVRRFWDRRADEWSQDVSRSDPAWLAPLAAALLEVSPPERALDIGTGHGDAALLVAREFPSARVRGVDISEKMVRKASERVGLDPEGRIAFRVGDAADLPWEDDSFDLVTQLNMPVFFSEIVRVLRPGGHVAIAASHGPATPYFTPDSVLRRGFRRRGLEPVRSDEAGAGTFFVARLPA